MWHPPFVRYISWSFDVFVFYRYFLLLFLFFLFLFFVLVCLTCWWFLKSQLVCHKTQNLRERKKELKVHLYCSVHHTHSTKFSFETPKPFCSFFKLMKFLYLNQIQNTIPYIRHTSFQITLHLIRCVCSCLFFLLF